ncbi:DUF4129 domain-containing protein [Alcanivorax sp. DP30]|uniref:DUF4129 domain-containing protein n=1 Tax=Alcanivorax sp. DP30 TaxID=2606217 RepID=UPI00136E2BAF|nr:DUF4129 domain-containing protein [Alcanivorax sp. DP30]MZR61524.1 DUF4129 domain-containing protein [Alcanivorax sp. DP30]
MELEKASARLAPRSPWQAVDLGTQMFRRWAWPTVRIWLAFTLLPFVLLLAYASMLESWWPLVLFWWFKPMWERPLLAWYSHALFAEELTLKTLFKRWKQYALPGLFAQLTWRRLSPSRSFNTAIWQLEGARGDQVSQRHQVLHRAPSNRAGMLTLVLFHIEQFMGYGLLALFYTLVPWQFNLELSDWFFEQSVLQTAIASSCLYLVLCITEPLYVACGFALYLNKRTWLEGWDLQLGLTRIGKRRKPNGIAAALLIGMLALPFSEPATAVDHRVEDMHAEQQQIIELLAGEDYMPFETRTQREWKDQDNDEGEEASWWEAFWKAFFDRANDNTSTNSKPFSIPDNLIWAVFWALFAGIVLWLLMKVASQVGFTGRTRKQNHVIPTHVAGLDIRQQSLPDDINAAVENALHDTDIRTAMSLLLRVSLATLLREYPVALAAGSTEQHCLRTLQRQHGKAPGIEVLQPVVNAWVRTAWAHRPVSADEVRELLAQWQAVRFVEVPNG